MQGYDQTCCSGGVPVGGTLGLGTADAKPIQVLETYDNNIIHNLMVRRTLLEWPVDVFYFTRYRHQTVDLFDENLFPGSGATWGYGVPGVNWSIGKDIALRGAVNSLYTETYLVLNLQPHTGRQFPLSSISR